MRRLLKLSKPKTCNEFETDLVLYAYGKVDSEERSGIEAHLDACAHCRARQDGLLEELAVAPLDFPPQQFWDDYSREMRQKLEKVDQDREHELNWLNWRAPLSAGGITAIAATLVLVIALGMSLKDSLFSSPEENQDAAMMEVLPIVQNLEFFESMHYLEMMDQESEGQVKSSDAREYPGRQAPGFWLATVSKCVYERRSCRPYLANEAEKRLV